MKSVLISIKPKWCELIVSGKKTVEVRKTRPKIETPFKVYIYCTTEKRLLHKFNKGERIDDELFFDENVFVRRNTWIRGHLNPNKKVIGEFVCDKIDTVMSVNTPCMEYFTVNDKMDMFFSDISCLDVDELGAYIGFNKEGYGWHISDLKIYDKPKELDEFLRICPYDEHCWRCEFYSTYNGKCNNFVTRPPQSWCYVEELQDV